MQIAVLIFDQVTALEAVVPYEVLSRLPLAQVTFVNERIGQVRCDTGRLALTADAVLDELPHPDVIVVPGGAGRHRHMGNGSVHRWLRSASHTATWVFGVGEGSLILAAAGVLHGRGVATSHDCLRQEIERLGALPVQARAHIDGICATAADAASAVDLALEVARRTAGTEATDRIRDQLASLPTVIPAAGDRN